MIRDELHDLTLRIEELRAMYRDHRSSKNRLGETPPPEMFAALERYVTSRGLPSRSDLIEFYKLHDGLSLPNLHNGYFVHRADLILSSEAGGEPTSVCGPHDFEILVFGSDGGGGRFAQSLELGDEIIYLGSGGAVHSSQYDAESGCVNVIAENFGDFLRKVALDIEAFVRGDEGWSYLIDSCY